MRIPGVLLAAFLGIFASPAFAADDGERFASYAGFKLGVGTLDDVRQKLGPAEAIHTGDGGESETRICYHAPSGNVSFLAGEIGGETELTGFSFSKMSRRNCAVWPGGIPTPPMELAGLRLGMSRQEFRSSVGGDFHWEASKGFAYFESRRKPTEMELAEMPANFRANAMFDVSVSVIGSFVDGKLAEIEVWKIETY